MSDMPDTIEEAVRRAMNERAAKLLQGEPPNFAFATQNDGGVEPPDSEWISEDDRLAHLLNMRRQQRTGEDTHE